jgi:hypothetical protein
VESEEKPGLSAQKKRPTIDTQTQNDISGRALIIFAIDRSLITV